MSFFSDLFAVKPTKPKTKAEKIFKILMDNPDKEKFKISIEGIEFEVNHNDAFSIYLTLKALED